MSAKFTCTHCGAAFDVEVAPCAFCGENRCIEVRDIFGHKSIRCKSCEASGPVRPTVELAIDSWNERHAVVVEPEEQPSVDMKPDIISMGAETGEKP